MERRELEDMLAEGWSLERIGRHVGKHPETVSYWLKKYGLRPVNREKHAARGALSAAELEEAVDRGLSIAQLAEEFSRSKATIRHWLAKYGLRTRNRVGRAKHEPIDAVGFGAPVLVRRCDVHGDTEFVLEGTRRYRCRQCRIDGVCRRRREVKARLVEEAGGRCCICGYDRHPAALQFHHVDRSAKELTLSKRVLSLEKLRVESRKCVLLCATCHAEVEAGIARVPLE